MPLNNYGINAVKSLQHNCRKMFTALLATLLPAICCKIYGNSLTVYQQTTGFIQRLINTSFVGWYYCGTEVLFDIVYLFFVLIRRRARGRSHF